MIGELDPDGHFLTLEPMPLVVPVAGEVFPDLTITTDEGERLALGDPDTGPLAIQLFKSWCAPCVGHLPGAELAVTPPSSEDAAE